MHKINKDTWKRRKHFDFFNTMEFPRYSVTLNIDISALGPFVKKHQISLSNALLYLTSRAMNEVEEFRMRIRDNEVYVHDVIHPSLTILSEDETFHFGEVKFTNDFKVFNETAASTARIAKEEQNLSDEEGRDDYIFISSLPWFSFTSLSHPVNLDITKLSIPRITWGKYFTSDGKIYLPLSLDVNHALVDGIHIGKFVTLLNTYLADLTTYLH